MTVGVFFGRVSLLAGSALLCAATMGQQAEGTQPQPPLSGPGLTTPAGELPFSTPRAKLTDTPTAPSESTPAGISVELDTQGEPSLVVRHEWRSLKRPSIQALLTDAAASPSSLKPLALDGALAAQLWASQVKSLNRPMFAESPELIRTNTAFFEFDEGKRLLTIRGRENSQKKPSAYGFEEKNGFAAVFYELSNWTDANSAFRVARADLDQMPRFGEAGKLYVWLLDEEQPIKEAAVTWPGEPARKTAVEKRPGEKQRNAVSPARAKPEPAPSQTADKPKTSSDPSAPAKAGPQAEPGAKPPAVPKLPIPEKAVTAPPAPAPKPPAPVKLEDMTVDQLIQTIEQRWGAKMPDEVRKAWSGGLVYFYKVENPEPVRCDILMSILRTCYQEQPAGELRDAFAILYRKLKQAKP